MIEYTNFNEETKVKNMKKQDKSIQLRISHFPGLVHTWSAEEITRIKKENRVKLWLARLQTVMQAISLTAFAWSFLFSIALAALSLSLTSLMLQVEGNSVTLEEVENTFSSVFSNSVLLGIIGCLFWALIKLGSNSENKPSIYRKTFFAILYDSLGDDFYINNLRDIKQFLLRSDIHPFTEIGAFFNEKSIPFKILNDEVMNLRIQRMKPVAIANAKNEAEAQ